MIKKLLLTITIIALLMSPVMAFEVTELKTVPDYTPFDTDGYSNYTTNSNRYFLVEDIRSFDDDFKADWFESNPTIEYSVEDVGNNTFYFKDDNFEFYGYQEVVEIDGDYYMVSINQNSKLSPSEEHLYLKDLQEFNQLNGLTPVEI